MATANLNPVSASYVNITSQTTAPITDVDTNDNTYTSYGGNRNTPTQHQYGFGGLDNTPTNSITQLIGDGTIAAGTSNQTFTIKLGLVNDTDTLSANPGNGQNVSYQVLLVNTSVANTEQAIFTDTSSFSTTSGNTNVTQVINWDTSQFPTNGGLNPLDPDAGNLELKIVQSGGQPNQRARKRFLVLDFVQWAVEANDPLLTVKSQAIWV